MLMSYVYSEDTAACRGLVRGSTSCHYRFNATYLNERFCIRIKTRQLCISALSATGHFVLCSLLSISDSRYPPYNNNNNNNNFLCANILENQAQWRDKTKGLSNCVNVEQCVSR